MPGNSGQSEATASPQPPTYAKRRFAAFLEQRGVAVLDVVRGAAPDTRRLLLGNSLAGSVRYAVTVAPITGVGSAVDNEQALLSAVDGRLDHGLAETLPRVVERLDVSATSTGLIVTAVRGLRISSSRATALAVAPTLEAVAAWLSALWGDTSGPTAQVDLGRDATELVHSGSARAAPSLGSVVRARHKLAQYEVARTLTHGCLCLRHTKTDGRTVVGVDDWGLGSLASDPLRDLGRFAVRVAGTRLPEVLAGRSAYAQTVRRFVTGGLERTSLPRQLWREVLLLTQLELALEALGRGDPDGIALLAQTVRALPAER